MKEKIPRAENAEDAEEEGIDSGQVPCRNDEPSRGDAEGAEKIEIVALGCDTPGEKAMQQAPNKMRGKARNKGRGYCSRKGAKAQREDAALGCGDPRGGDPIGGGG